MDRSSSVRGARCHWSSALGRFAATAMLMAVGPCFATVYYGFPGSTMGLGQSINPLYPTRAYLPCVEYDGTSLRLDVGTPNTQMTVQELRSRQDLYRALNIDANLSANAFFGSGSASFKLDEKYQFSSEDIYYSLRASSDFGRVTIKSPKLTAEAASLAPKQFKERCGTEFVYQERRAAQIVVVYSLQRMSEERSKEVQAALSASGFGVTFSGSYKEIEQGGKSRFKSTIDVYAVGGGGVSLLKSIPTSTSLEQIRTIASQYVEQLIRENAASVEFVTASWESLGVRVPLEQMEIRNAVLPELYFTYRENEIIFHRVGDLIRTLGKELTCPRDKRCTDLERYQHDFMELASFLRSLRDQGTDCLESEKKCLDVQPPRIYKVLWPAAVFERIWSDTDEFGAQYTISFTIPTVNLHYGDPLVSGSFTLPLSNARISSVEFVCQDPKCAWSYPRNGGGGNGTPDYQIAGGGQSFTWWRKWDGDAHAETYVVHYQVEKNVCVANCSYVETVREVKKPGGAAPPAPTGGVKPASTSIKEVAPNWNWSSDEKRELVRNAMKGAKGGETPKMTK